MELPKLDKLRIVYYPHIVLKQVAEEVIVYDQQLSSLAERMLELMHVAKGVGLAAPQVALRVRMFVCNVTGEPEDDTVFVNPRILEMVDADEQEEGCLSLPGVTVTMRRAKTVTIEAFDLQGNVIKQIGDEIQSRVWIHEIDHLDGRLIIDNMSPADEIKNRRALKQLLEDKYSNEYRSG